MKQKTPVEEVSHRIWTIPNLLSFFRLALIPVFVWLYWMEKNYPWAAIVLVLSCITDLADGWIARHFHMISVLGKALDPIADKLTQGVLLICLLSRFPAMGIPLVLLIFKEAVSGIIRLRLLRQSGQVYGAAWHGKISTVLLDALALLHVVWYHIPPAVSYLCIGICTAFMFVSFLLYCVQLSKTMRRDSGQQKRTN